MRIRVFVLTVVAALVVVGLSSAMAVPKLKGTVGPGFTITLKNSKGKTVKLLKVGKYRFVVTDKASTHNFTLDGPGFEDKTITGTGFTGTKAVTLKLKKGKYKYYCTVHTYVKGTFKVS
jgi:plastocyanin